MKKTQAYTHTRVHRLCFLHTFTYEQKFAINLLTLGSMLPWGCEKTNLFNMKALPGFLPQWWHCPWIKIVLLFSISWNQGKHSVHSEWREVSQNN